MEEKNNNEKKRQIRLAITGLVALLLLTLSSTFAYFLVSTNNSTSASQINAEIEAIDSIALQKVTGDLHINLSAVDMSMTNKDTEYYGDDAKENNYVKTLDEGMHNLGKLTATGGNGKTKYMCTANAVVTMQVATENDMGKFFNEGDAYLYLNAGTLQQRIDLSELKTSGTKTIPFEIGITSEEERILDGYVEIVNRDDDQTYLANKTLNIDVTFKDLDCNVGVSELETYLRGKDTENKLTTNLVNGLYRYQGNSIVNSVDMDQHTADRTDTMNSNYICLGADCNATGKDLYRIIGVTEDGLMKVIKNIPLEQVGKGLPWWIDSKTDVKWPQSLAYQYLNNEFYNTLSIDLKEMIVDSEWKYGDVNFNDLLSDPTVMELMGTLEEGDENAKKEASKEFTKFLSKGTVNLEEKNATSKTIGKVSLMSITDYCSSFENNSEINCMSSLANTELLGSEDPSGFGISWLTTQNDWLYDWTMSRFGFDNGSFLSWFISPIDSIVYERISREYKARPVFFLTSDIELFGNGTIKDPFRIGIE